MNDLESNITVHVSVNLLANDTCRANSEIKISQHIIKTLIMSYLDKKVSIFKNYMDAYPVQTVALRTFLKSTKYKDRVERIRTIEDKKERDRLKAQLPAITPSGIFKIKRAAANLVEHSGLIQLDIDSKENEGMDMEQLKEDLCHQPNVCFCAWSVSGTGLFALVPIAQPERHREHFLELERDMLQWYDVVIDSSCKDVCRLRGYSYDADCYINDEAVVYTDLYEPPVPTYSNPQALKTDYFHSDDTFQKAMEIIVSYEFDITGDYPQWFAIMCGIASEFGEEGRSVAHVVSGYSDKYDEQVCDEVYSKALQNSYGYYWYVLPLLQTQRCSPCAIGLCFTVKNCCGSI